jgi:putative lipase involved disintegration of autophagic bodies
MGVCNGVTSTCALGGYAMESRCHMGRLLKYDTVSKRNWGVGISRHSIKVIVEELLHEDWDEDSAVPPISTEADCVDCFNWTFGDYNKSLTAP